MIERAMDAGLTPVREEGRWGRQSLRLQYDSKIFRSGYQKVLVPKSTLDEQHPLQELCASLARVGCGSQWHTLGGTPGTRQLHSLVT